MSYQTQRIFLSAIFGFAVCVVFGYLLYGTYVFRFIDSRSTIITFGLAGSIYFGFLRLQSNKVKLVVVLLLIIAQLIFANNFHSSKLITRDVVLLMSLFIAINIYNRFVFKRINSILFLRSLLLCLLFTILYSAGTIMLVYLFEPDFSDVSTIAFTNAKYAALTGLAIGLGFDLHEKIIVRAKWNHKYITNSDSEIEE